VEASAIIPFVDQPREAVHWTKFKNVPEASAPEIKSARKTEIPRIQEVTRIPESEPTKEAASDHQAIRRIPAEPTAINHHIHLEPPRPRLDETQGSSEDEEKKPLVGRFLRWLYPSLYDRNRRGAERRPSPGLVAYEVSGSTTLMHEVDNISSTGIYLRTNGRWEPGARVSLTLQRSGPPEENPQQRIELAQHDADLAIEHARAQGHDEVERVVAR